MTQRLAIVGGTVVTPWETIDGGVLRVAQSQLRFGTTGFLPTTIAARHGELLRAAEDVLEAEKSTEPAAQILGIGRTLAYELIRRGEFPVKPIALGERRIVIPCAALDALLGQRS